MQTITKKQKKPSKCWGEILQNEKNRRCERAYSDQRKQIFHQIRAVRTTFYLNDGTQKAS